MLLILNGFATVGVTTDKAGEHRRTVLSRSYTRFYMPALLLSDVETEKETR